MIVKFIFFCYYKANLRGKIKMLAYPDLDISQARNFITYFEIQNDKIIVYYANKQSKIIDNTPDNIDDLLAKMERQLTSRTSFDMSFVIPTLLSNLLALTIFTNLVDNLWQNPSIYKLIGILALISPFVLIDNNLIKNYECYDDFQKNRMFRFKRDLINEKIMNENFDISSLKLETITKIYYLRAKMESLNINNIHNFTRRELDDIISLIENKSDNVYRYLKRRYF